MVLIDVYNRKRQDSPYESPLSSTVSVKRKREDVEEDDSSLEPSRPLKRYRIKGTSEDDVKGTSFTDDAYARLSWFTLDRDYFAPRQPDDELTANAGRVFRATGNRRHVLGILVNRLEVRFYFMDHAGIVYTTPLDFRIRSEAILIIASIISLSFIDATGLGLEPYFATAALANTKLITPMLEESLLQQKDNFYFDIDDVTVHAEKQLHVDQLFGRGTVVWEATPAIPDDTGNPVPTEQPDVPSEVVLKIAWQTLGMHHEDALMRLAAERGVQGVARPYRNAVVARLSDGLRGRLVPASMYADRELRVQVMGPRAMPLYEVKDLDIFKTAFRSLVTGEFVILLLGAVQRIHSRHCSPSRSLHQSWNTTP